MSQKRGFPSTWTANLPVQRVLERSDAPLDRGVWPATLAPIRSVFDDGFSPGAATVITGENGVGKSTLVEAIAEAFGLNVEGGTTNVRHATRAYESPLAHHLRLVRGPSASRHGFFLRAETMHGLYTYLEEHADPAHPERLHELSHGESFLELVESRSPVTGLWILDEPESALSLSGCLALIVLLRHLMAGGSQVILSTHSPVLAALPGATLLELGEWGLREVEYDEAQLVRGWRGFLEAPERYLRHVL